MLAVTATFAKPILIESLFGYGSAPKSAKFALTSSQYGAQEPLVLLHAPLEDRRMHDRGDIGTGDQLLQSVWSSMK